MDRLSKLFVSLILIIGSLAEIMLLIYLLSISGSSLVPDSINDMIQQQVSNGDKSESSGNTSSSKGDVGDLTIDSNIELEDVNTEEIEEENEVYVKEPQYGPTDNYGNSNGDIYDYDYDAGKDNGEGLGYSVSKTPYIDWSSGILSTEALKVMVEVYELLLQESNEGVDVSVRLATPEEISENNLAIPASYYVNSDGQLCINIHVTYDFGEEVKENVRTGIVEYNGLEVVLVK